MAPTISRREMLAQSAGWTAGAVALHSGLAIGAPQDDVEYRRLGRTGLRVSGVGFGALSIAFGDTEQDRVSELLNRALDNGLNFIDTAECYPGAEEKIGVAIGRRRSEYFISSKVGHEHGAFGGGHNDWSAASILRTIDRSLERLRTDHLDVVFLHGCSVRVLREGEAIDALRRAQDAGKIRFPAYSGDGARAMAAIESDAFDALQVSFNVFHQDPLDRVFPAARRADLGIVIKRPVANAVWRFEELPEFEWYQGYWNRMNELDYSFMSAEARADPGPEGAGGVALRWVLATPGVHTAIVGTTRPGRWSQNNRSFGTPMSRAAWQEIRDHWLKVAGDRWREDYS